MENYLMVNGKKIPLTEEQVAQITGGQEKKDEKVALEKLNPGDAFRIGACEFLVLEQEGETTAVIKKDFLVAEAEFGENNNYEGSSVEKVCDRFGVEIAEIIGAENMVEHTVDLTADDGLKDYGKVKRRMSLLTADLYRRHVEILDAHKVDGWWWLATPYSTKKHGHSTAVKCVAPSGNVYYVGYYNGGGVRPFCILKSNIFVSV